MYIIQAWPNEIWLAMAAAAPIEHAIRALVGAIIGSGVISGLRAIGLIKPRWALY
jgi:hypothetical protein